MKSKQARLTVSPPEQPDFEITLIPIQEGMMFTKETVKAMTELVKKERLVVVFLNVTISLLRIMN